MKRLLSIVVVSALALLAIVFVRSMLTPKGGVSQDALASSRSEGALAGVPPAREDGVRAALAKSHSLGFVKSPDGAGIGHATVCWKAASMLPSDGPSWCISSSETGRFEIFGEVPDSGALVASAVGYVSRSIDAGSSSRHKDANGHLQIVLSRGGLRLAGEVIDALGGPISGALVTATVPGQFAMPSATVASGANGAFALSVPAGRIDISARAIGYARASAVVDVPTYPLSLVLAPESTIVGRVITEGEEEPVQDILVQAYNRNGVFAAPFSSRTEVDGRFRMRGVPPGGYELLAFGARYASTSKWVAVGLAQDPDEVVIHVTPAASLHAQVRVTGEACRDGSVEVSNLQQQRSATVDARGFAAVEGLFPGHYSVLVRCQNGVPKQESIDVGTEPLARTWELETGGIIRGRVVSASGSAVEGVVVAAERVPAASRSESSPIAGAHGTQCATNADGAFECGPLQDGDYSCTVISNFQGQSKPVKVSLQDSSPSRVVVLTMDPSGHLRARASNQGRRPSNASSTARIFALGNGQAWPLEASWNGEAFVFDHLALGQYQVCPGRERSEQCENVALVRDGESVDVSVEWPSITAIAGYVREEDGSPVVDAWIRAIPAVSAPGAYRDSAVMTDEAGAFVIEDLAPGTYNVVATSSAGEMLVSAVAGVSDLAITIPRFAMVSGSVRTAAGAEVQEFQIQYENDRGESQSFPAIQGRWSVQWLAPGTYAFTVTAAQGSASQRIDLAAGASAELAMIIGAE